MPEKTVPSATTQRSVTGSTDSKPTVKKKKTVVKAAKPGTTTTAKPAATAKAKDDKKKLPTKPLVAAKPSTNAKSTTAKTTSPSKAKPKPSVLMQQTKLQKAQQTKREVANLDCIEQAFQQDRQVWCPTEPTGGWMYRTDTAGRDGPSADTEAVHGQTRGLLFDETAVLEQSLRYNNLSSSSLTPQAYTALLEQARRYALELLADAQEYAQHASRSTVASLTPADITLAAELRGDMAGIPSTLPKFEEMAEYASDTNRKPLPPIPAECYTGVVLPPVEEQLTFRTFDIVNGARVRELPLSHVDGALSKKGSNVDMLFRPTTKSGSNGLGTKVSYGAIQGKPIAIHFKGATTTATDESRNSVVTMGQPVSSKNEPKHTRKLTEL